jgi:hypothetical protein
MSFSVVCLLLAFIFQLFWLDHLSARNSSGVAIFYYEYRKSGKASDNFLFSLPGQ